MNWQVEFHPLFERDVQEHGNWLEEQSPGMGDEFRASVEQALDSLDGMPARHQSLFGSYRRVLILRFRVLIPFRMFENTLRVLGLVHGARDIARWLEHRDQAEGGSAQ